jgi:hypothetical protein
MLLPFADRSSYGGPWLFELSSSGTNILRIHCDWTDLFTCLTEPILKPGNVSTICPVVNSTGHSWSWGGVSMGRDLGQRRGIQVKLGSEG